MRVRVGLGLGLGRGDGVRAGVVTSGLVRLLAVNLARLGEGACSDPLLAWLGLGIGVGVGCRDRTRVRDSVRVGVGVRVRDGDPLLAFALPLRDPFAYARVPFLVRGRGRGRVRVWVRVWVRVRVGVRVRVSSGGCALFLGPTPRGRGKKASCEIQARYGQDVGERYGEIEAR